MNRRGKDMSGLVYVLKRYGGMKLFGSVFSQQARLVAAVEFFDTFFVFIHLNDSRTNVNNLQIIP